MKIHLPLTFLKNHGLISNLFCGKHFLKLCLVVCFASQFYSVNAQTQLIGNNSFETGDFTDWQEFPSAPAQISITTTNPSDGSNAANINNTASASSSLIKSANRGIGIVNPGDDIQITFDARGSTAAGGVAFAEFFTEISGGGTSSSQILGGAPLILNADPDVWTNFSFNVHAGSDTSGGITLQFAAITGAATGSASNLFIDNVSMINNNEILSISDNTIDNFRVFPNPSSNQWNITSNQIINTISVFDILGKKILNLNPKSTETEINATALKSGIYFAKIQGVSGSKTIKLVRK